MGNGSPDAGTLEGCGDGNLATFNRHKPSFSSRQLPASGNSGVILTDMNA
ncbi:MAG: hypothetical protein KME26_13210 [Oscillatoria princeps RMCB-10]|nr:hypothetical protein [Oscillatoria princeps RMCB-10]